MAHQHAEHGLPFQPLAITDAAAEPQRFDDLARELRRHHDAALPQVERLGILLLSRLKADLRSGNWTASALALAPTEPKRVELDQGLWNDLDAESDTFYGWATGNLRLLGQDYRAIRLWPKAGVPYDDLPWFGGPWANLASILWHQPAGDRRLIDAQWGFMQHELLGLLRDGLYQARCFDPATGVRRPVTPGECWGDPATAAVRSLAYVHVWPGGVSMPLEPPPPFATSAQSADVNTRSGHTAPMQEPSPPPADPQRPPAGAAPRPSEPAVASAGKASTGRKQDAIVRLIVRDAIEEAFKAGNSRSVTPGPMKVKLKKSLLEIKRAHNLKYSHAELNEMIAAAFVRSKSTIERYLGILKNVPTKWQDAWKGSDMVPDDGKLSTCEQNYLWNYLFGRACAEAMPRETKSDGMEIPNVDKQLVRDTGAWFEKTFRRVPPEGVLDEEIRQAVSEARHFLMSANEFDAFISKKKVSATSSANDSTTTSRAQ
jgi:hypothetical protein